MTWLEGHPATITIIILLLGQLTALIWNRYELHSLIVWSTKVDKKVEHIEITLLAHESDAARHIDPVRDANAQVQVLSRLNRLEELLLQLLQKNSIDGKHQR